MKRPGQRRARSTLCGFFFASSSVPCPRMQWNAELAYFITPRSGPMRPMRTLADVNQALLDDLPHKIRHQPRWQLIARLVLAAARTASPLAQRIATDALLQAVEAEGWMTGGGPERAGRIDGTDR
jgi:hypothetical protein